MRLVAWNCNMALPRKAEALLRLKPDVAAISECAKPDILAMHGSTDWIEADPVWIGDNPNKGLGVFTFNGYSSSLSEPYFPTLKYIAPVHINGPINFNMLAVWAQNVSIRKNQPDPLSRALTKYRDGFLNGDVVVAGDLNNNAIWDKPGWRINHMTKVAILEKMGLVSVYHELTGELNGAETQPTHYWRDRAKDGPTYHIDFVFVPTTWIPQVSNFTVGTFEDWCGSKLSDHVPLILDLDVA